MNIILASQSPRRKELLERMGIRDFETISPNVDESVFHGLPPEELVRRLSAEKAAAVAGRAGEDAIVIAADTVVALEGAVLGKPADELDAFKMLSALSGVRHQVYTGVTVCRGGEKQTAHGQGRGLRHPGLRRSAYPGHQRRLLQCDGPAGVPPERHARPLRGGLPQAGRPGVRRPA